MAAALAVGGRACLDTTAASPSFPASLEALRALAPVALIAVRAPPGVCLERVRRRDAARHLPASEARVGRQGGDGAAGGRRGAARR